MTFKVRSIRWTVLMLVVACGDLKATSPLAPVDAAVEEDAGPPPQNVVNIAPKRGSIGGGTLVAITGQNLRPGLVVTFDGAPATDITVQSPSIVTARTPPHAPGVVSVQLVGPDEVLELPDAYEYVSVADDAGPPRLVSALSTSNTSVRVTFSEPVAEGAEDPSNYGIVQANVNSESGALLVKEAQLSPSRLSVVLTTASQNEVTYELSASEISDLDGNLLAPPELLVNPTLVRFAGTPPSAGNGTLVDEDGDGLADSREQSGWVVSVVLANGDRTESTHTSDPTQADTDQDGLSDGEELAIGSNPRIGDTDGDGIGDAEEFNDWYSDTNAQDSDSDGLSDGIELFFETSPILDDTDGDGMDDNAELTLFSRDPLLANLPLPQIVVQGYDLQINVLSSYTDEQGATRTATTSASSSFAQSRANSASRSDTRSTEATNKFSQELGVEIAYSTKDGFGGKVNATAGFEQSSSRGFSSTVEASSASESQASFDRSVENALESSERRAVTREVSSARIVASVNLANRSDVPFRITNMQISVQQQDRAGDGSFRPVATLVPSSGSDLALNLGPFDPERGPIIFENSDVFPSLVEDLIREPSGVIFKMANFDVLDEQGRIFAFSSATVKSRTAGITIDFGNGVVETYRVATHSQFGANGRPLGISLERALGLVGLTRAENDAALSQPPATTASSSYGTRLDTTGVERLVRIRTVQNDLTPGVAAEKRFWAIQTSNTRLPADTSLSDIQVRAGDEFLFFYTRDLDEDGLHEQEELLYGSLDNTPDTDGDGLVDFSEVRTGWTVAPLPGRRYRVFSSPARADSDLDGLSDARERDLGTDPNRDDTDVDALGDQLELNGPYLVRLFDGDANDSNNPQLEVIAYSDAVILDGGDAVATAVAQGDDVQVVAVGAAVAAGGVVISAGPNGVIDSANAGDDTLILTENVAPGADGVCNTLATGDDLQVAARNARVGPGDVCVRPGLDGVINATLAGDDFIRTPHEFLFATHPLRADTDFDGIPDGREVLVGTNPNSQDVGNISDSDRDGLYDAEETRGWTVASSAGGGAVRSNPLRSDSDQDGIPDVYERAIGSNPQLLDTDRDGLLDGQEFDVNNPDNYYSAAALVSARNRCSAATSCSLTPPSTLLRTSVVNADSDGDGLRDKAELDFALGNPVVWQVAVTGAASYNAEPKPWAADFDGDGLNDSSEYAQRTDPNLADTDGDGTSDAAELSIAGRSPLVPDKRVRVRYTRLIVNNICGDGPDTESAEWFGNLQIVTPDSTTTSLDCSNCCQVNGSGSCSVSAEAVTVVLQPGQQITLRAGSNWYEEDPGILADVNAGAFSITLSYADVASTPATIANFTGGQGDCANSLSVEYTVTVD